MTDIKPDTLKRCLVSSLLRAKCISKIEEIEINAHFTVAEKFYGPQCSYLNTQFCSPFEKAAHLYAKKRK